MIRSFLPIVDHHSTILILGSIPGIRSLQAGQYYAHPANQFWKIIFDIVDEPFDECYCNRVSLLKNHSIALWDVIASCERKGSLDTNIQSPIVQDFPAFFSRYPGIHAVFFNGMKAKKTFDQHVDMPVKCCPAMFQLPSTSPAMTRIWSVKREAWKAILCWL